MPEGAVDNDFDDAERPYAERVEAALDGIQTEPYKGGIVIDLVTRQPLFVRRQVADTLAEYYDAEGFDLATYKQHAFLPVRPDDAVFECVFIGGVDDLHGSRKTYDYPRGRLAVVPVDLAWRDAEVGSL
jgi:hypothetical protein